MHGRNAGKENSRFTLSRRAKNEAKKLTISPLKEKDFNSLGITPVAAPEPAACAEAVKEADRITQLEQEKSALERLCEEAEARTAAAVAEKEALDTDRKELAIQNARLAAQVHLTNLQHQENEREMEEKIKALEKSLREMRDEKQKEKEEHEHAMESEHKKYVILQKAFDQANKDLESKSKKLDKLQELTQVSKEIATNLQSEKQTLIDQLAIERDTTKKLHSLAESSTEECARMEMQMEEQINLIESLHKEVEGNKKQLFLSTALAIKLHKLYYDKICCNLSIHELWDKAQQETIPVDRWSAYIEEALDQSTSMRRKGPKSPEFARHIQLRGE